MFGFISIVVGAYIINNGLPKIEMNTQSPLCYFRSFCNLIIPNECPFIFIDKDTYRSENKSPIYFVMFPCNHIIICHISCEDYLH